MSSTRYVTDACSPSSLTWTTSSPFAVPLTGSLTTVPKCPVPAPLRILTLRPILAILSPCFHLLIQRLSSALFRQFVGEELCVSQFLPGNQVSNFSCLRISPVHPYFDL